MALVKCVWKQWPKTYLELLISKKQNRNSYTAHSVLYSKWPKLLIKEPQTKVSEQQTKSEPSVKTSTIKIDAHTAKWLNYKVEKAEEPEKVKEDPALSKNNERRPSAFSRLTSYTSAMSTTKSLSSDSTDSPKTVKKYQRAYAGKKKIIITFTYLT